MGYYKNIESGKLVTVVIIDIVDGKNYGRKYHNVKDDTIGIRNFKEFTLKTFPAAKYFNVYDPKKPKGKNYLRREYVKN